MTRGSIAVAVAVAVVACSGQRCGPRSDSSDGTADASTDASVDLASDGGGDAGDPAAVFEAGTLTTWRLARVGDSYEVEWQVPSSEGFRVYRRPLNGSAAALVWTIETQFSATTFSYGNDRPTSAGVGAVGVNPNRYPSWYVVGSSAGISTFTTCDTAVTPMAGNTSAKESWVALPRDCSGTCGGNASTSYWRLAFAADGGVSAASSCFDGGGFSEPRQLHPDLPYEVRNVGVDFTVRNFADGGAWPLPAPGVVKRWRFLPKQQILAYGWEESGRYTAPAVPPDDLKHELRIIRFTIPDAGYELLPPGAREHVVDVEVARELGDGRLLLAGRPPQWWKSSAERRAVVLSGDARTAYDAFRFSGARYDLAELNGEVTVVKQVDKVGPDGGVIRSVVLERPSRITDGGN